MGNEKRLLWAGFMAILAAGVGFAVRGGIFDNWGSEFGFTGLELGAIGGAGLSGFCFAIIIGGIIADKIGYGKLVIAAFALHVLSAFVTFAAGPGMAKEAAYAYLFWGMFIFAFANGTLEAVANPLVAAAFPQNRTHYLNILHASWPLGLVLGSVAGWILDDKMQVGWKTQLSLYLIPTLLYGIMFFGQKMPKSEASQKGLSLGEMFKDVGLVGGLVVCLLLALFFRDSLKLSPGIAYAAGGVLLVAVGVITKFSMGSILLFALFAAHALVGAVELGTDQWMQNLTGTILNSEQGKLLFVFTSLIMFGLRFCAHFIEKRLGFSPVGILLTCAVLACAGLWLTSSATTLGMAFLALTVYALGKTFFWPTMLAVASDRFPRTGAIAISIMGGIGMMSGGLIGIPGLGYARDRFGAEELQRRDAALYERVKADKPSKFPPFRDATAIDGKKLGEAEKALGDTRQEAIKAGQPDSREAAIAKLTGDQRKIVEANVEGSHKTIRTDAVIPGLMAVIYLLILLYFKSIGGYKPVTLDASSGVQIKTGEPAKV